MKGKIVGKYSYEELKNAALQKRRIGGYKGYDVFSCSSADYHFTKPNFYVIYDDGKKLVRNGYVYGSINNNGTVTEVEEPYAYIRPQDKPRKPVETKKPVPASDYSAFVAQTSDKGTEDFFSRIDREICELLETAKN